MKFPPELLQSWLERHASLELLCEFDDWPDTAGMQVKLQESASDRLRLLVSLNETMPDTNGYSGSKVRRCGCFDLLLDEEGQPHSAVLIRTF